MNLSSTQPGTEEGPFGLEKQGRNGGPEGGRECPLGPWQRGGERGREVIPRGCSAPSVGHPSLPLRHLQSDGTVPRNARQRGLAWGKPPFFSPASLPSPLFFPFPSHPVWFGEAGVGEEEMHGVRRAVSCLCLPQPVPVNFEPVLPVSV